LFQETLRFGAGKDVPVSATRVLCAAAASEKSPGTAKGRFGASVAIRPFGRLLVERVGRPGANQSTGCVFFRHRQMIS
jgi:hypothetical protein